ncbi:hypothetical protein MtrunA17_Chr4g0030061 [Medicago truncatula]|uniref:Transmembrane protein, putative n=1 Tax=Medicago truncatula TaxID=3880 RepID=A0A072UK44_MEDTR|nr:transmembrane protein, putative [Medicago truncatula]RHN60827.1 hypothetical protein MtrunA17_Chr4g0030061 [Medicago truncatula]
MFGLMLTSNDVKDGQGDTIDNDIGSLSLSLSLFWSIHTLSLFCSSISFLQSFVLIFLFYIFGMEWNNTLRLPHIFAAEFILMSCVRFFYFNHQFCFQTYSALHQTK